MKNINKIRLDFPLIATNEIAYLDNASTTQKPQAVIDALVAYYMHYNANIYRGVHTFAEKTTTEYENARSVIAQFIGAQNNEVIFTSGTTEGINFIAQTWGQEQITKGDEIVITQLEHHANILPWQRLAEQTGATLIWYPVQTDGVLDMSLLSTLITHKTKLIAITAVSNAIGTHVDVTQFVQAARAVGAKILLDAAQLVAHAPINVHSLDVDFLVFSGHKLFGPTGVGILYIKETLQDAMPPYQLGGGMVFEVLKDNSTWLKSPQKFEAGTPPIAQAIGLGAAVAWIKQNYDWQRVQEHEALLCQHLIENLSALPKIRILGPANELTKKGHLVSFVVEGMHAHDVAAYLNTQNIAVRAGHHCAQPLAQALGYSASVRASFTIYNTLEEVDRLIMALLAI